MKPIVAVHIWVQHEKPNQLNVMSWLWEKKEKVLFIATLNLLWWIHAPYYVISWTNYMCSVWRAGQRVINCNFTYKNRTGNTDIPSCLPVCEIYASFIIWALSCLWKVYIVNKDPHFQYRHFIYLKRKKKGFYLGYETKKFPDDTFRKCQLFFLFKVHLVSAALFSGRPLTLTLIGNKI